MGMINFSAFFQICIEGTHEVIAVMWRKIDRQYKSVLPFSHYFCFANKILFYVFI